MYKTVAAKVIHDWDTLSFPAISKEGVIKKIQNLHKKVCEAGAAPGSGTEGGTGGAYRSQGGQVFLSSAAGI